MKVVFMNWLKLILGLFIVVSLFTSCGNKRVNLNCSYDTTVESGKTFYQPLINALEKYKVEHENYPTNVFELVPKYIDKIPGTLSNSETPNSSDEQGNLYVDKNIKSQIIGTRPDTKSYFITFYFRDDSSCFLNKNGVCAYNAETKNWLCK